MLVIDLVSKIAQGLNSLNNKQIFHAFLFNIRNSPELSNIQRLEAELNIILPRVNNFDVNPKSALNICFIIYPSLVNAKKAK